MKLFINPFRNPLEIYTGAGKFVVPLPRFRDFPPHVPRDGIEVGRKIFDSMPLPPPSCACTRIMWRGCAIAIDEREFGAAEIGNIEKGG